MLTKVNVLSACMLPVYVVHTHTPHLMQGEEVKAMHAHESHLSVLRNDVVRWVKNAPALLYNIKQV